MTGLIYLFTRTLLLASGVASFVMMKSLQYWLLYYCIHVNIAETDHFW